MDVKISYIWEILCCQISWDGLGVAVDFICEAFKSWPSILCIVFDAKILHNIREG